MQSTWIEDSFVPPYEPAFRPIATWAVPAAFSSSITCPRGFMLGLRPIPSSAMTSPPVPARSTRSRSIEAARPPSIEDHAACFEPEDHRLVDETLDRVRDGQVGDEDAVSRVLERRDEDLPARIVPVLAGPERVCIGEPGPAGDPEGKVGAGRTAEPHRVGAPDLGEEPFGDRCQIRCGPRELVRQQCGVDEPKKEATTAVAEAPRSTRTE